MSYVVGIDLGGTQIKAAALTSKGDVLHRQTHPTRDGEQVDGVPAWADTIRRLLDAWTARFGAPAGRVGLAAPGAAGTQRPFDSLDAAWHGWPRGP